MIYSCPLPPYYALPCSSLCSFRSFFYYVFALSYLSCLIPLHVFLRSIQIKTLPLGRLNDLVPYPGSNLSSLTFIGELLEAKRKFDSRRHEKREY